MHLAHPLEMCLRLEDNSDRQLVRCQLQKQRLSDSPAALGGTSTAAASSSSGRILGGMPPLDHPTLLGMLQEDVGQQGLYPSKFSHARSGCG